MASIVMLGVAVEQSMYMLADAIEATISDASKRTRFRRKLDSSRNRTAERFEYVRKNLEQMMGGDSTAGDLSSVFPYRFAAVANLIRESRNDAGHPTTPTTRDSDARRTAYASLELFKSYIVYVYELLDWLRKRGLAS